MRTFFQPLISLAAKTLGFHSMGGHNAAFGRQCSAHLTQVAQAGSLADLELAEARMVPTSV